MNNFRRVFAMEQSQSLRLCCCWVRLNGGTSTEFFGLLKLFLAHGAQLVKTVTVPSPGLPGYNFETADDGETYIQRNNNYPQRLRFISVGALAGGRCAHFCDGDLSRTAGQNVLPQLPGTSGFLCP